ncbi:MAG: M56 family metallopeptidase [Chryseolinea sp.]
MKIFLNYLLEANLGLCLFLLVYACFLRKETDFTMKRFFLLGAIGGSLLFPLLHFNQGLTFVPSLGSIIPVTWLPEVVVLGDGNSSTNPVSANPDMWTFFSWIYGLGIVIGLILFLLRLTRLYIALTKAPGISLDNYIIVESDANRSAFSFFRFIYIGLANQLSPQEKALIIHHESIHARQLHSFDVLLINVVGIFFWFNPAISIYKKIFIHLHEFEADARAVKDQDVDNYCSLLAKVALLSADFKLANHFSNSLTVKRIEMIRTLKAQIKRWKMMAIAMVLPCFFFVVACQEQVMDDMTDIARNSSNAVLAPEVVQARFEEVKKANPGSTYILVELNKVAEAKLAEMEKAHGLPKSIELFTPDQGSYKRSALATGAVVVGQSPTASSNSSEDADALQTYAIIEYNEMAARIAEQSKGQDEIYAVVEESPEFPGGMDGLGKFLMANVRYPSVAREQGIEGVVYVSFVVNKDGSVSDIAAVKGLSAETDAESLRVVSLSPNWKPGKVKNQPVRARFVLPIKFKLGSSAPAPVK